MENIELTSGVYKILNKINNKVYIGSPNNLSRRFREHKKELNHNKHHNQHLQNAWNKYSESSFEFIIIEFIESELLLSREQNFINNYNACDKNMGYNILKIAGNTSGYRFSDESKDKMSKTKNINNSHKTKILLEITLSADTNIIYNKSEENKLSLKIDKTNPFYGNKHTVESKKLMSEAKKGNKNLFYGIGPMLGKTQSDKQKSLVSIANSGKNNKKSKPVQQYTLENILIREWDSAGMIKKFLNISTSEIWRCCNNKQKTSHGFIWKYI
jgi:group I intron endonuclease